MLHSGTTNIHRGPATWLAGDEKRSAKSPKCERGAVDIGKVNLILIGLIVVILFGLLSKEDGNTALSRQEMRLQTQISSEAGPEEDEADSLNAIPASAQTESAEVVAPVSQVPEKTKIKPESKKAHKTEATAREHAPSPVVETHASQVQPVSEQVQQKDPSRSMLVFNIWSVSELRLRSAYTTFMNDSAVPAPQLELRKKDYLNFVNHRAKKCGELDNKFAGNINTVERLTFSKGDVDILECHAAENNSELDKLHAAREHSF